MIPITELIGGYYVMKGVVGIGKLGVNWVKSLKTGAGDAAEVSEVELTEISGRMLDSGIVSEAEVGTTEAFEAGTEVTAEEVAEASSAALRATGVGILIAVGIDVILNAINGAIEKKELDDQIDKLTDQLKIVQTFKDTVDAKAKELNGHEVDEMNRFMNICTSMKTLLPAGHTINFDYQFDAVPANIDKFITAQNNALNTFSLLMQLRTTYVNAKKRNPHVTKDVVVNNVLLTAPDWVTYDLLVAMWDQVLAKYSTLMKDAN